MDLREARANLCIRVRGNAKVGDRVAAVGVDAEAAIFFSEKSMQKEGNGVPVRQQDEVTHIRR